MLIILDLLENLTISKGGKIRSFPPNLDQVRVWTVALGNVASNMDLPV